MNLVETGIRCHKTHPKARGVAHINGAGTNSSEIDFSQTDELGKDPELPSDAARESFAVAMPGISKTIDCPKNLKQGAAEPSKMRGMSQKHLQLMTGAPSPTQETHCCLYETPDAAAPIDQPSRP